MSAAPSNSFASGLRLLARLFLELLGCPRHSHPFSFFSLSTSLCLCFAFLFSLCSSRCSDVGELSVSVPRLPRLLPGLLWLLLLLAGLPLPKNNTASCITSPELTGRIGLRDSGASPSISWLTHGATSRTPLPPPPRGLPRISKVAVDPRRHVSNPVRFSLHVVDAGDPVRGDGVAPHTAGCVRRADAALEYASEATLAYIRRGSRERWHPEHSDSF